jgi:serine phosphatase RsbU (regulator of sigma subunit)
MAMIKAVFAECIDSGNSENFLEKCNQVLLHLKIRGWNRMMTLQTLVIDSISGEFSILNAGQCFPALVSDIGQKIEFLDIPGTPLGFKISRGYNQLNGIL